MCVCVCVCVCVDVTAVDNVSPADYLMWMCLLCVCIDITCHTLYE